MKKKINPFSAWLLIYTSLAILFGLAVWYRQSQTKPATQPETITTTTNSPKRFTIVTVKTDAGESTHRWTYDTTPKVGDECLIAYDGANGLKVARTENDIEGLYKAYVRGKIIDVFQVATGAKLSK
jgi:hypothetical protein